MQNNLAGKKRSPPGTAKTRSPNYTAAGTGEQSLLTPSAPGDRNLYKNAIGTEGTNKYDQRTSGIQSQLTQMSN